MPRRIRLSLTPADLELLIEALDSHRYWQLSSTPYRSSGYVLEPGSDDEEAAQEIRAVDDLEARLSAALPVITATADQPGKDTDQ